MRFAWLACALMLILPMPEARAQGRPAGVATDVVSVRQMSETISVFGEVVAGRQSAVAARVAGVAVDMPLRVGDRVKAGDVLAQIDTELLGIQLSQAEAAVSIAEAGVAVASARVDRVEKAYRRAEDLVRNSAIAESQLDDRAGEYAEAVGSRQEAQARIVAAQAALAQARYNLTNATITAPFDAVVLEVTTEQGQFVSVGSQIATLIDIGAMEVEANVPSRFITALTPGQVVEARTDAGGMLMLELRAILPTEYAATRTRPVRFEAESRETEIAVGQSVTLDVPVSAPREVVVVPKDALIQARGGWSVFLNMDGKATPRPVQIGATLGDGFEVLSGLAPGDEVVVRGNERLRPGQDIMAQPAGGGAGAPAQGGRPAASDESGAPQAQSQAQAAEQG